MFTIFFCHYVLFLHKTEINDILFTKHLTSRRAPFYKDFVEFLTFMSQKSFLDCMPPHGSTELPIKRWLYFTTRHLIWPIRLLWKTILFNAWLEFQLTWIYSHNLSLINKITIKRAINDKPLIYCACITPICFQQAKILYCLNWLNQVLFTSDNYAILVFNAQGLSMNL